MSMSNHSYSRRQSAIVLPEPMPVLVPEVWAGAGMDGSPLNGIRALYVKLSDAPSDLYLDAALDARIELLRYRERKTQRRTAGFKHPAHWLGGINPVDDGRRTRGGGQYLDGGAVVAVDRPSEWLLFGLDDHVQIGRIPVEAFYRLGSIQNEVANQSFTVPIISGSRVTNDVPSRNVPQWHGPRIDSYFRFRVTIKDPDGDGTNGDRLVGPESATIKVTPSPYPIWPAGGRNTSALQIGFADGPLAGN